MNDAVRKAMAPTNAEIALIPYGTHAAAVADMLGNAGTRALDAGCGNGQFTRLLTRHFKSVAGIDVNARRIAAAQTAAATEGVTIDFRTASAEAMPFAGASFDAVVFSNSLHHIPDMDRALAEAKRVLAPGGLVYVMEPVPAGSYFRATRLVSDETEIRTEAYLALQRAAANGLTQAREHTYRARRIFSGFEEWRDDQIERDKARAIVFEQQPEAVRVAFLQHGEPEGAGIAFETLSRVNLLSKAV